jgi:hypothetical protein
VTALLARGLVADLRGSAGRYRLHVTPAGTALLAARARESGTLADGEPAVLLMARDALACPVISYYRHLLARRGSSRGYLAQVEDAYTRTAGWQEANPARVKVPGTPSPGPQLSAADGARRDARDRNEAEQAMDEFLAGLTLAQVARHAADFAEHLAHVSGDASAMDRAMALQRRIGELGRG